MTTETLLSVDEIRHRLWAIRQTSKDERNARRAVGFNTIARQTGLTAKYLYLLTYGERQPSPKAQAKLSASLHKLQPQNLRTLD
jgi:hypothetical protein